MLLTLLQNTGGSPPVVPPPENTADIGPGDYSAIEKEFKLRGEVRRKRLPKAAVKKIKKAIEEGPTPETLQALAREIAPFAAPDPLITEMQAKLEEVSRLILIAMKDAEAESAYRERLRKEQQRVIIEVIAAAVRQQEEDEILLAYII